MRAPVTLTMRNLFCLPSSMDIEAPFAGNREIPSNSLGRLPTSRFPVPRSIHDHAVESTSEYVISAPRNISLSQSFSYSVPKSEAQQGMTFALDKSPAVCSSRHGPGPLLQSSLQVPWS